MGMRPTVSNTKANELRDQIVKRTGFSRFELVCPHEQSEMTPCINRDGALALADTNQCVGCGTRLSVLIEEDQERAK